MGSKEVRKRILEVVSVYKGYLILSLIFATVTVALTLYVPILIGKGIDYVVSPGKVDFGSLLYCIVKIAVIVLLTAVAQWAMSICNNRITYHTVRDIRMQAFAKLEQMPIRVIDSKPHGELISRIINDVHQFADGLLMGFSQFFTGVITIIGTLIFMLAINFSITILVVVITPLSLFVAGFVAKRTYRMFKLQSETRGEMTSLVNELVGNQKIVKAFSYEERSEDRFLKVNEELKGCSLKAIFFSSITNPTTRFVNGLVYAGVGILGAIMAMRGLITVGQLSCFLSYANQYTKPFNEISGVVTELQNAIASAGRVFELIDTEPEAEERQDAIVLNEGNTDGRVSLSHVSFSYDKEKHLIEGLNLAVQSGQRVAIVGPTGCGKTTIINLLMRFYDVNQGEICVSGIPIKNITRSSLRNSYGMVLQETWLKSATVAENIAYGKPGATREEITQAAKSAHAHSFIKRLPNGYDTVLSEAGGNLSAGQKQLLCIARVMLSLPPMLILDEATSSIDTRTEIRIQRAFEKMLSGRTSFIVAHRLSTIQEADVILVMNEGHIIEQGTHEELLEKGGFYSNLYQSQFVPNES